jgi:dsDNA-specific endonuclease/ATPase MutS2
MAEKRKLFIYEALELRSEYDARIKTFKDTLPETRQNRDRLFFTRDDDGRRRPSPDFDMAEVRRQLRKLEVKRRKLNSAIQQANFNSIVDYCGESINLNEALEARKSLNEQIGELHTQVVDSAFEKVIYKEGRDIVEENELSYTSSVNDLDHSRLAFRELNRKLRKASFETLIEFADD